jgi:sterol desaturase/sphingolipid hydroxylase (fatty acid hydroxylase superfamily)
MTAWWSYVLLFFSLEFAYYWHHRASHEVRWFWATHNVHHSPQKMYLSGAVRLGWTGQISGAFLFYAPLVWLGFHPLAVIGMLLLNLVYQFWLHTELIGSLGWFDRVFNSPSNHRVHHAINPIYLDRNYGGVIVLFDHLFGTYEAERCDEPTRYGLVKQIESHNPFRIAFNEWLGIAKDLSRSRSFREVTGFLFGRPGWSPSGKGQTSADLRDHWHRERAQRGAD